MGMGKEHEDFHKIREIFMFYEINEYKNCCPMVKEHEDFHKIRENKILLSFGERT